MDQTAKALLNNIAPGAVAEGEFPYQITTLTDTDAPNLGIGFLDQEKEVIHFNLPEGINVTAWNKKLILELITNGATQFILREVAEYSIKKNHQRTCIFFSGAETDSQEIYLASNYEFDRPHPIQPVCSNEKLKQLSDHPIVICPHSDGLMAHCAYFKQEPWKTIRIFSGSKDKETTSISVEQTRKGEGYLVYRVTHGENEPLYFTDPETTDRLSLVNDCLDQLEGSLKADGWTIKEEEVIEEPKEKIRYFDYVRG